MDEEGEDGGEVKEKLRNKTLPVILKERNRWRMQYIHEIKEGGGDVEEAAQEAKEKRE